MAINNRWIPIVAAALILTVAVAAFYAINQSSTSVAKEEHTLFQISAFNKFSMGSYEGNTTYAELARHGDFGMGTLNGLDGEMIAFDGVFYYIPSDGNVRQVSSTAQAPFAMVTFFKADKTFRVTDEMNYSQLTTYIDNTLPSENSIYAVKIHGTYDYAKTRSVPLQTKPYQNLTEAIKNQTIFTLNSVEATIVGYRCPTFMDGINVAGYHLHFLTDDKSAGGHLLDCIARNVTVEIDQIDKFEMTLP